MDQIKPCRIDVTRPNLDKTKKYVLFEGQEVPIPKTRMENIAEQLLQLQENETHVDLVGYMNFVLGIYNLINLHCLYLGFLL